MEPLSKKRRLAPKPESTPPPALSPRVPGQSPSTADDVARISQSRSGSLPQQKVVPASQQPFPPRPVPLSQSPSQPLNGPPLQNVIELKDFYAFAHHLQDAAILFKRQSERPPFGSASVLLLRWEEDASVEGDLASLESVFRERFRYKTDRWNIPSVYNPSIKLGVQMARFLEHAKPDHLLIIYYAGHGYTGLDGQLYWACNGLEDAPRLKWDGVRCLFEDAQSDILLLLDTCSPREPAASGSHGMKQLIAARGADAAPKDPIAEIRSFTAILVESLSKLSATGTFTVRRLYEEISRTMCPGPVAEATTFPTGMPPPRPAPVLYTLTPGKVENLILSILPAAGAAAQSPGTGRPLHHDLVDPKSVADLKFDDERVLVCTTFLGDASVELANFKHWLDNTPSTAARITVEGIFLGPNTNLLISMPRAIYDALQECDRICLYLGQISSHNLLHLYHKLVGPPKPQGSPATDVEDNEMPKVAPTPAKAKEEEEGRPASSMARYAAVSGGGKVGAEELAEVKEAAEQLKALKHLRRRSDEAALSAVSAASIAATAAAAMAASRAAASKASSASASSSSSSSVSPSSTTTTAATEAAATAAAAAATTETSNSVAATAAAAAPPPASPPPAAPPPAATWAAAAPAATTPTTAAPGQPRKLLPEVSPMRHDQNGSAGHAPKRGRPPAVSSAPSSLYSNFQTQPKVPRRTVFPPDSRCVHCTHVPFKDSTALRKHIAAVHTRPFPCAFSFAGCTSTFGSKNEWKRHITSQHLCLTYYRCSECPKKMPEGRDEFNRKDLFTQHLRRMHAPCHVKQALGKGADMQDAEWELHVKELQQTCLVKRRLPPRMASCPKADCRILFEGTSAWDEWTEHVGRHMEKSEANGLGLDELLTKWALNEGIVEALDDGEYRLCEGCMGGAATAAAAVAATAAAAAASAATVLAIAGARVGEVSSRAHGNGTSHAGRDGDHGRASNSGDDEEEGDEVGDGEEREGDEDKMDMDED